MRLNFVVALAATAAALGAPAGAAHAQQSLRGSPAKVERMYQQARRQDLTFYRTSRGVRHAAADGDLVRLSGNADYRMAGASYPYALPTTRTFVQRLARQYREECGERLVVTSATRPKSIHLANSVAESVHPSGMAVDLRKPRRASCLRWMRQTLVDLKAEGVIEAVEEHHPPHFHVAVFPRQYAAYVGNRSGVHHKGQLATADDEDDSGASGGGGAPARSRYHVRRGDTLWTIARRHGVSVARIREANNLRSSRLAVGQSIVIPGVR